MKYYINNKKTDERTFTLRLVKELADSGLFNGFVDSLYFVNQELESIADQIEGCSDDSDFRYEIEDKELVFEIRFNGEE